MAVSDSEATEATQLGILPGIKSLGLEPWQLAFGPYNRVKLSGLIKSSPQISPPIN